MKNRIVKWLPSITAVNPVSAIGLFVLLQVYLASNRFSFAFWKSSDEVFLYMLVFYGAWLLGLLVLLSLLLAVSLHFNRPWIAVAALVVLSIPFSWKLWIGSFDFDNPVIRQSLILSLVPLMFFYFRVGLEHVRETAWVVLILCALSFFGHSQFSLSIGISRDFDRIDLDRKPNVHVIVMDSFTRSSVTREFMGIENPGADYLETLDNAIHAGDKGFVEDVGTKNSMAALFELEKIYRNHGTFNGRVPSLLTVLLRENGYTISTGFLDYYFGLEKGKHIDYYHVGGGFQYLSDSLVCSKSGSLGFCYLSFSQILFEYLFAENKPSLDHKDWSDRVINSIDQAERNLSGPLFSIYVIHRPIGHTSTDHQTGDEKMFFKYKEQFVRQARRAREVVEKINRLRKSYPESIFIVTGDHGPYLSRTAPREERRFIVLDRYAVALSLLNASNLCSWSRDWLSRQHYLTPSRMLAASLACDGESRKLVEHFTDNEEFIRFQ